MSKIFEIWVVYTGGDDRFIGTPTLFFSSEYLACHEARGKGWYGGDAPVRQHHAVEVDGKFYLLEDAEPIDLDGELKAKNEQLKEKALAKLSEEEKRALGLMDE